MPVSLTTLLAYFLSLLLHLGVALVDLVVLALVEVVMVVDLLLLLLLPLLRSFRWKRMKSRSSTRRFSSIATSDSTHPPLASEACLSAYPIVGKSANR